MNLGQKASITSQVSTSETPQGSHLHHQQPQEKSKVFSPDGFSITFFQALYNEDLYGSAFACLDLQESNPLPMTGDSWPTPEAW